MPIHDWTRVDHGTFHDFHQGWAPQIRSALNNGLLPPEYEAKVEQHTDDGIPDVLALRLTAPSSGNGAHPGPHGGISTVAVAPPKVSFTSEFASDPYTRLRKTITVRRDDRIVALIELVSPGNKSSRHGIQAFVRKVTTAIDHGIHVLVIDLFPPGPRDPNGVHPVIWSEFRDEPYTPPANRPLTLASYEAGAVSRAYIQPVAVGEVLPDMPLFLEPGAYVSVPLEATYTSAFEGISRRTRDTLTAPG